MTTQDNKIEETRKKWYEYATKLVLVNSETLFVDVNSLIVDWWLKEMKSYGSEREQRGRDMAVDYIEAEWMNSFDYENGSPYPSLYKEARNIKE